MKDKQARSKIEEIEKVNNIQNVLKIKKVDIEHNLNFSILYDYRFCGNSSRTIDNIIKCIIDLKDYFGLEYKYIPNVPEKRMLIKKVKKTEVKK